MSTTGPTWRARATQYAQFAVVGLGGVVVNLGVFNLLRFGPLSPDAEVLGSDDRVVTAKVIAAVVSIAYAWVAHRLWTFRGGTRHRPARELVLFGLVNAAAVAIEAGVVAVSHYVLGLDGTIAENVASLIGVGLGTIARWAGYNLWVFNNPLTTAREAATEDPPVGAELPRQGP